MKHPQDANEPLRHSLRLALRRESQVDVEHDMHDCTKSVLLGVRAHDLLRKFASEDEQYSVNSSILNEERRRPQPLPKEDAVDARREKTGLLIALTPDMLHVAQATITLWRCWCRRWGMDLILDTDQWMLQRDYRHPNWMRWIRAKAHLPDFGLLFIVDADTVLNLAFWDFDLARYVGVNFPTQQVIIRDIIPPGTLNNGVVALRGGRVGLAFLESLLEKMSWMQTAHHDQAAFDETVLEFGDDSTPLKYDSRCVEHALPGANGDHSVAAYSLCWWEASEELFGPPGSRNSSIFGFVDPEKIDINYVVTTQNFTELGDAYIYHFAGPGKCWEDIRSFAEVPAEVQGQSCSVIHNYRVSVHDFATRNSMGS
ncbi:hypothetical protein FOL47_010437, partial [Perkinsus chesapeaki]